MYEPYDINLLFSGLALETTYGDAKKIEVWRVSMLKLRSLRRTRVEEEQPAAASQPQVPPKLAKKTV